MEQMIVFVYDTTFCQTEEDDPQKAVLYFHPNWVGEQQRLALCGQLMGATHFCSSVFSTPRVLTLQSGKFVLKKFGQFILSVGSDQTLPDWMLNERFNILENLLEFYHKSFDAMLTSVNSEYELFTKKLSEIFKIYNPIIQYVVSTLGSIPNIKFPRKKSAMFLEAFQLLESCCAHPGVLGGTILHKSRVIATLLDSNTTKILALTDPFRIRSGAEEVKTPFHLPVGVQLLRVYVTNSTYASARNAGIVNSTFSSGLAKKQENVAQGGDVKHDITKIFTVPEEDDANLSTDAQEKGKSAEKKASHSKNARKQSKSKGETALKERSKSFVANHNIKVCSTPTVEKKIVHEDLVSICSNAKIEANPASSQGFVPESERSAQIESKENPCKFVRSKYTNNRLYRISMDDLMIDLSYKNYPVPLKYYSFGLPKICKEVEQAIKDEQSKGKLSKTKFYKTIADPSNPVFRFDGFPVSKSLYNHCLDEHYKDFITANITIDSREEFIRRKNLENELFKRKSDAKARAVDSATRGPEGKQLPLESDKKSAEEPEKRPREKGLNAINQKLFRRSLTLPLKPLTCNGADGDVSASVAKTKVLHSRTPTTPLMTKLSLLVLEEQNESKNCSASAQPSQTKCKLKKNIPLKGQGASAETSTRDIVTCALFVFGQQNLTTLLLLDESAGQNPNLMLSLWEICSTSLENVELMRNKSIDHLSSGGGACNSYSFLSLDPDRGTMNKSGTFNDDDMKVVGLLHQDLIRTRNITEIIVRNEDAVVYGYRCGSSETFYQQGKCSAVGLPTPGDLMGVVPLKARRRLERDHGVVLL